MRKDPVHSEERRQQHLRKTILDPIIRRRAGLFWALFCGLTFFSDLLHFDTGHIKGLNAVALGGSKARGPPLRVCMGSWAMGSWRWAGGRKRRCRCIIGLSAG
jgi:hypothetical protein